MHIHYAPPLPFDVSQLDGIGDESGAMAQKVIDQINDAENSYISNTGAHVPIENVIRRLETIAKDLDESLGQEDKYSKQDLRLQVRNLLENQIKAMKGPSPDPDDDGPAHPSGLRKIIKRLGR